MKTNLLRLLAIIFSVSVLFTACNSDDDNNDEEEKETAPTVIQADNEWYVDSIVDEAKWYKVTGSEAFNKMKIQWTELGYHGANKDYTADIQVSVYKLDGATAYKFDETDFVGIDVGWENEAKEIFLQDEDDILIKVGLTSANIAGTYAVKVAGMAEADTIQKNITIKDEWKELEIEEGQVFEFEVDATGYDTLFVVWAEAGTEGFEYTADVMGSVYMSDGETAYEQYDNPGKYFEDKDKSEPGKEKGIIVDDTDKIVKIYISKNAAVGTFALKVYSPSGNGGNTGDEIEYIEINGLQTEWLEGTIEANKTVGYKVKHGLTEEKTLEIIWSEIGAPEETYTAEISGSVYKKDAETPYIIVDSDKEFVDKNKSWSDDPKAILIDPTENNIRIHLTETAGVGGTYAIKIVEKVK